jgi:hypothetical protein
MKRSVYLFIEVQIDQQIDNLLFNIHETTKLSTFF